MSQCYRQLRLDEREAIFRMKDTRLQVSRIAERLGRHPSTIYRELRRNVFCDEDSSFCGYLPIVSTLADTGGRSLFDIELVDRSRSAE